MTTLQEFLSQCAEVLEFFIKGDKYRALISNLGIDDTTTHVVICSYFYSN